MFAPAYVGLASRAKPIQVLSSGVRTHAKWTNTICFFLGSESSGVKKSAVSLGSHSDPLAPATRRVTKKDFFRGLSGQIVVTLFSAGCADPPNHLNRVLLRQ